jgi:MMPL family
VAGLADLALRRPAALLAANLAVLALAVVLAVGAPEHLGIGSLAVGMQAASGEEPDLVVATTGRRPVHSGPYRVALRVISAQLSSDSGVSMVHRGGVSPDGRSTSLEVTLASGDDGDRQRTVERVEREIDPGPLRVAYGGQVAAVIDARHDLSGDLWKLELVAAALALALLAAVLGPWLAVAPVVCAATAIAGALAGLRIAGGLADVSLLGIAPAAVLGLTLGIEAPSLLLARFRDEAIGATPDEAIRRALGAMGEVALPLALGTIAATAGLLATGFDPAPSMVLACALAVILALGSALVCVPALLALEHDRLEARSDEVAGEPVLAWAPRTVAGYIASSRARTGVAAALAAVVMLAAATPLLHGESRPFSSADLPSGSQAAKAAHIETVDRGSRSTQQASPGPPFSDNSLFERLALAAGVSAAALALVLAVAFSPRAIPVAVVTLLPAAAACGLCVLLFQDGHFAGVIGQRRQGALETGATASLATALVLVSAARTVTALRASRSERSFGLEPPVAAETAAAFTVPAAIYATVVTALAVGVLAGTDLYPAREFGLAAAVGLLMDLILLRVPLLAALARWAGSD